MLATTLVAFATVGQLGCGGPSAVDILRVQDIGPRQAEIGDRVEITGQQFPQAGELRRVRVRFRGTLARSGASPCTAPVDVTLTDPPEGSTEFDPVTHQVRETTYAHSPQRLLRLDGPDRLALVLTESLFASLTQCPGERASGTVSHATLSFGAAQARFARLGVTLHFEGLTGTRAIEGTLRGATLDLLAPASQRVVHADLLRRRAQRALDSMGIQLAEAHPALGLRVASVRSQSSAALAGIGANDVLSAVDGLSILSLDDLALAEHTRAVRLAVSRDDILDERTVPLDGYATSSPDDQLAVAVFLLVIALLMALATRGALGTLSQLTPLVHQALGNRTRGGFVRWVFSKLVAVFRGEAPHEVTPWLVLVALGSTLGLAPFLPALLRMGWDVGLLFALGTALRLISAPSASWRSMARALPASVIAISTLTSAVLASGTFRAEGVVAAQAGLPWQWHAFRSPATLLLSALFLLALLNGAPDSPRKTPHSPTPTRAALLRTFAGWVGTTLVASAGVVSLFGGWQLPMIDLGQQDSSAALQMLGSIVFLAKTWTLSLGVCWVRWAVPSARTAAWMQRSWRVLVGSALAGLLVHALLCLALPRMPLALSVALSRGTFALIAATLLWLVIEPKVTRRAGLASYEAPVFSAADESSTPR
ncbi:MAG: NADH-quinone oxidoreductase subunit H [Deltaproteobacteria bacterium]|nr:NADH-quinone oxidoreductase subunit H [Deltaproteobacteria bacterium]